MLKFEAIVGFSGQGAIYVVFYDYYIITVCIFLALAKLTLN